MNDFKSYLDKTGEIGYVDQVIHSLVQVEGLPSVKAEEMVMFESGGVGQVMSLTEEYAEVLPLTQVAVNAGERVVRVERGLEIEVGEGMLGKTLNPLGEVMSGGKLAGKTELRAVEAEPAKLDQRKPASEPLTTGVSLVDLVIPLAKGQRELIIGDRKTGKSGFLTQALVSQIEQGAVCVYAVIGKKQVEAKRIEETLAKRGVAEKVALVISNSADPAGLINLTPFTAMAIGEYFRDQGKEVVVILDDLTTHAKFYRQLSLLAKRFPGRSSYPGDIFYVHARLLERAGVFKNGVISCLPVAESVLGDVSGYLQTNLMAMTDGHLYFDGELANLGRRPAVNPFLSVTRVGRQVQTSLMQDVNRSVAQFLASLKRYEQFMHFGAELTEKVKRMLDMGEKLYKFFELSVQEIMPIQVSVWMLGLLWTGRWTGGKEEAVEKEMKQLVKEYKSQGEMRKAVDEMYSQAKNFTEVVNRLKQKPENRQPMQQVQQPASRVQTSDKETAKAGGGKQEAGKEENKAMSKTEGGKRE